MIMFFSMLLIVFSTLVNAIFFDILNIGINIKIPFSKKYKDKITPIYKITNYEENQVIISKFILKQIDVEFYLNYFIPIPFRLLKYKYVNIHCVNNVSIYTELSTERNYDDFVKICEDDIIEKKKISDIQLQKENNVKSFDEKINKIFNQNYFK